MAKTSSGPSHLPSPQVNGSVYIIGAGVAGLSAAVTCAKAGARVIVFEGAQQAGGRCRSFHDKDFEEPVDNGSHVVLGNNRHVFRYLKEIGSENHLVPASRNGLPFFHAQTGRSWQLRTDLPLWPFQKSRRAPDTTAGDYIQPALALSLGKIKDDLSKLPCSQNCYEGFWEPLLLAALNTPLTKADPTLAATILKHSLYAPTNALTPFLARPPLSETFIDPAVKTIEAFGGRVLFGKVLQNVSDLGLSFKDGDTPTDSKDRIIVALPPWAAPLENIIESFHPPAPSPILNVHFLSPPAPRPETEPSMIGVIGGTAHWIFRRGKIISATVSAAENASLTERQSLVNKIWSDACAALALPESDIPPHRTIIERRATPYQDTLFSQQRPGHRTRFPNIFLAGDWVATGLPCTLESAVFAGQRAAHLALGKD